MILINVLGPQNVDGPVFFTLSCEMSEYTFDFPNQERNIGRISVVAQNVITTISL